MKEMGERASLALLTREGALGRPGEEVREERKLGKRHSILALK